MGSLPLYRLPEIRSNQIIATEASGRNFELWLNSSEEVNILAHVERKDKGELWLNRQLTLPGHPSPKEKLPLEIFLKTNIQDANNMQKEFLEANGVKTSIIPRDEHWSMRTEWEIPALQENLSGRFELKAYFEPLIGEGKNFREIVPFQSTEEPRTYTKELYFKAGLLPEGIYGTVVSLVCYDRKDEICQIYGMEELGFIRIHDKSQYDVENPFAIPLRANICNTEGKEIRDISVEQTWMIHATWETPELDEKISGSWKIEVYLNPMGPMPEIKLPKDPFILPVKKGLEAKKYEKKIEIEPGCVEIGIYKPRIIIHNIDDDNNPTNLIGLSPELSQINFID